LDYYAHLNDVTRNHRWEDWVIYFLNGIEETAHWTLTRIHAVRELMDETAGKVQREAPKIYSRELVELIFIQPYCRIANVVDAGIAERQTASVYLKKLAALGILRAEKSGREVLFLHPALLRLLKSDHT
jgi:Fic family protein